MSVQSRPAVGFAVLLALCLAAVVVRTLVHGFGAGTIDKSELVAVLERYRAVGNLTQLSDWMSAQPQLGEVSVPIKVAAYLRMMQDASSVISALAPLGAEGIRINAAYRDDRLNLYLIRGSAHSDPDHVLDRTGVVGNAALIFGNIIIVDVEMFDQLAAYFYRSDEAWARRYPGCDDFAHGREGDNRIGEIQPDQRSEACASARTYQFILNRLRFNVPLWVLLHEIGHFAYAHTPEFASPEQMMAAELQADAFLMRIVAMDATAQAMVMVSAPVRTVLSISIEKAVGRPLRELLYSDQEKIYSIPGPGGHPPIAYRALTLVSLQADMDIARGEYFEWGDEGQLLSRNHNRYKELLRRIRLVRRRGVFDALGIAHSSN